MLKAQPRFSGNGGHGKRLLDLDESVAKRDEIEDSRRQYKRGRITRDVGLMTAGASIPIKSLKVALPTAATGIGLNITGTNQQKKGLKRLTAEAARRRAAQQSPVIKRERAYDAELNRQRRQGMYVAGGAAGSAGLAASGARDVRALRQPGESIYQALARFRDPATRVSMEEYRGAHSNVKTKKENKPGNYPRRHPQGWQVAEGERGAIEGARNLRGSLSRTQKLKLGGKLGGAAVLAGGSAGMYRHSRSKSNRRWN